MNYDPQYVEVSVLNTESPTWNPSQPSIESMRLNGQTRIDILKILNYNSGGMTPKTVLESRQMAAVFKQLVEQPVQYSVVSISFRQCFFGYYFKYLSI